MAVDVVIGTGGVGLEVALLMAADAGPDDVLVVADLRPEGVRDVVARLAGGTDRPVVDAVVDVADRASVEALARRCAERGPVRRLAHTAGVSPVQAGTDRVWAVDLLGTVHVLEAFEAVTAPGGAAVVVASMAGRIFGPHLDAATERALATLPAEELLGLPTLAAVADPQTAYGYAKRGNQLRVAAASAAWGRRGARVNSVSPGVVDTPMGRAEMEGVTGELVRAQVAASAAGRAARPEEVAHAVLFLLGPQASYITGTDLLVDGGTLPAFG